MYSLQFSFFLLIIKIKFNYFTFDTPQCGVRGSTWSVEEVVTFVRSLGTAECFQFTGDQLLQLGVNCRGFFELSLNELCTRCTL